MHQDLLSNETAIVTGGSSGIGRATVKRFAAAGANVVIADRDRAGGKAVMEECETTTGELVIIETDVTENEQVQAMVDETLERFGTLDVLVNNAGVNINDDSLHRIDEATWNRHIDINLSGMFRCAKAALEPMIESGGGRMVHMSSVNALTGIGFTSYSSAKAGIFGLSRLIAVQYGRFGIRSNVLCPGTIETKVRQAEMAEHADAGREEWLDQYPLDRFGRPEEVADAAVFLSSEMSSFISGTELVLDGGLTAGLDQTIQDTVYRMDDYPE